MKINDIKSQLRIEGQNFVPDNKEQIMRRLSIAPATTFKRKSMHSSFKFSLVFTVLLVAIIGISLVFSKPATVEATNSIVTIDINPSIEIELDKDDNIIDVRALNVDGALVLETLPSNIWNELTYQVILNDIIEASTNLGYIDRINQNGNINISATNKNQEKELNVSSKFKTEINNVIQKHSLKITVKDNGDDDDIEEIKKIARDNNISVGKMKQINKALEANPSLTLASALKLTPKQLNDIIQNYNKTTIDDFINQYKENENSLKNIEKRVKDDFENRKKQVETIFEAIEDLIDEENPFVDEYINTQITHLLNQYKITDFEFNPDNAEDKFAYYEEVLDELEDIISDHLDELENNISNNIKNQNESFKKYVKDRIKNNNNEFKFDWEFDDFDLDDLDDDD